ncbi:MAG: hypothetical protein P8X89_24550, partial [Reinekea sp.]
MDDRKKARLELQRQLMHTDQEYEVQPGDTLYQLNIDFDYVPNTLRFANIDRMQSWGRGPSQLRPGDILLLPAYTEENHSDRIVEHYETIANNEWAKSEAYRQHRNQSLETDPNRWNSVRIYWGDNNPTSFEKTLPLPLVFPAKEATTLKHDVTISSLENHPDTPMADLQPAKVKSFQQAHLDGGTLEAAQQTASDNSQEEISLPNELLYDYHPHPKATVNRESPNKDIDSVDLFPNTSGVIASAVSQYLIVRIELMPEINGKKDIEHLPNLLTWAFLQPPTIGGDFFRKAAHNDWVVDDAPRAGWFEAEIYGSEATFDSATGLYKAPMRINRHLYQMDPGHSKPQKHKQVVEDSEAWIKIEPNKEARLKNGSQPKTIALVKFNAVVRSNLTKEAFKYQRDTLLANKDYPDLFALECGSYLKAWVRNLDMYWSKQPEYLDDDPEDLRLRMESQDALPQSNIDALTHGTAIKGYNPQMYCNHSWRRERIADGLWITDEKGKKTPLPAQTFGEGDVNRAKVNLMYVGLYPSELIEALNKL